MVQLLMDFRDTVDAGPERKARELGLTLNEYAFYGILMAEITHGEDVEAVNEDLHLKSKRVAQQLVAMMDEATKIVDFFDKSDEKQTVRKKIRRTIIGEFDDQGLVKPVTDRFMELAEVKFR